MSAASSVTASVRSATMSARSQMASSVAVTFRSSRRAADSSAAVTALTFALHNSGSRLILWFKFACQGQDISHMVAVKTESPSRCSSAISS